MWKLTIIVVQPLDPQTKIDQENDNEGKIKCIPHLDGWNRKHNIQEKIRTCWRWRYKLRLTATRNQSASITEKWGHGLTVPTMLSGGDVFLQDMGHGNDHEHQLQ